MKIEDVIASNIIKICNDNKIEIKDLAESAGFTEERLNKILLDMGMNRRLTIVDLDKIVKALNEKDLHVEIVDLFKGIDNK